MFVKVLLDWEMTRLVLLMHLLLGSQMSRVLEVKAGWLTALQLKFLEIVVRHQQWSVKVRILKIPQCGVHNNHLEM